jgi:membrane fusion protein (multidrug efflux system)
MFSRTMRSLNRQGTGRTVAVMLAAMALLAAWGAWFVLARVAVYEVSDGARLEVDRAMHPIQAPVAGQVVRSAITLGREVHAGDVLLELDSAQLRAQLAAERASLAAYEPQLAALRNESAAHLDVLRQIQRTTAATLNEARAHARETDVQARFAATEAARMEALGARHQVAELDAMRARAEAQRTRAAADAARLDVLRLEQEQRGRESTERAAVANLASQIAELAAQQARTQANIPVLEQQIEFRLVRAPVDGRLGEVENLRAGSVVAQGERLAAVVPPGQLRVVAEYAPQSAVGRIHAGQHGRVRVTGFPWTEYGTVEATVSSVGSEVRDGRVRVELTVLAGRGSRIPMQHGLPGVVEIEVERASPAVLLLRAAGRWLSGSPGTAPAGTGAAGTAATTATTTGSGAAVAGGP